MVPIGKKSKIILLAAFLLAVFLGVLPGEEKPKENNSAPEVLLQKKTVFLFLGDIMLDRGVEYLTEKESYLYPLEEIKGFLEKADFVFANLEGPIVKDPPHFSDESMKFAFSEKSLETISYGNFDLLSLANNHTLNMQRKGLKETKELLEKEKIGFVGDPIYCGPEYAFEKEDASFLAFNRTYPSGCPESVLLETVEEKSKSEKFLIVYFHWGQEYQLESSPSQSELARKTIDLGADLIIGSHPHVVQEIDIYEGKLIFYSLGNFIFDQYFSKETQESLALSLEILPEKTAYKLYPLQGRSSRLFLMEQKKAEEFLSELARRSSPELKSQIEEGIITIK